MRMTHAGTMKELKIGHLTATRPIIQGGMGVGISLAGMASAVANEGGIGVIATAGIGMSEPDLFSNYVEANVRALKNEIRKARRMTDGILGVNIMVALTNFADLVRAAVDEGIDVVFAGAGLPLNLPSLVERSSKTRLVPIVSSGRAAALIARKWTEKYDYLPDAIVVEGPKAGGHLGFKSEQIDDPAFALEILVSDTIAAMKDFEERYGRKVPVIAAGGVYTGANIYKFMKMGAAGVQMATRFVATVECDATDSFKQTYVNASEDDIVIIKSPVGLPGRAIRNGFINDVSQGQKKPFSCPYHCIITCDHTKSPYCIALALRNAKLGKLDQGFAFAGANAHRTVKIVPMRELVQELKDEYRAIATKARSLLSSLSPAQRQA
jgi:nitronate monooxygenase